MKLFIVHNHFRPGGVRRLLELATPHLVRARRPGVESLALVAGERPDAAWLDNFVASVKPVPISCHVEPALRYFAEQRQPLSRITRRLRSFLSALLADCGPENPVVWAHNQGLGRNLLLTRELFRLCDRRKVPLILHHHDWWFDNRWQRWPELRRSGFRTLSQVASTIFPTGPNLRAVAVNQADTTLLKPHYREQAAWWPNPAEEGAAPHARDVLRARRWMQRLTGQNAPIWLMPCRLVRRKNIAEALLLTRWLRPAAWLLTTGGVSSPDEEPYANRLAQAARQYRWQLRLGILAGDESAKPSIPQLIAASQAILLTSLQEGFGFPYLEAAAARRPLIARAMPNMAPDLKKFGFRFPQSYAEILVAPGLFDWSAECQRQRALFRDWLAKLPRECRELVSGHPFLPPSAAPRPVPFSRLTLTAQIEVLAWPAAESFALCAPLNPRLSAWRVRALRGTLATTRWPRSAAKWLSGPAYARRFAGLLEMMPARSGRTDAAFRAQASFLRSRLDPDNLYPILWSIQT